MSAATLNYEFEDLYLLSAAGARAMPVTGSAEIQFDADGEWWVHRLFLRAVTGNGLVEADANPLEIKEWEGVNHRTLDWQRMETALLRKPWFAKITDAVATTIEDAAFDDTADFRHDMREAA